MGTHIWAKFPPDHTFHGKRVLNVGCGYGQFKAPNVVNLDAEAICEPNVVWDLSKTPLPFDDNSFDVVIANHILEHVPNWWRCFEDFSRILVEGGKVVVYVPGVGSDSVLGYRDHINTINRCSFYGTYGTYRNGSNAWAEENRKGGANRLKLVGEEYVTYGISWLKYAPLFVRKWCVNHLRNAVIENGYIFRKVTEQEFQEEEQRARGNRDGRRVIQLPVVSSPGFGRGH